MVEENASLKDVILEISSKRLGATAVGMLRKGDRGLSQTKI